MRQDQLRERARARDRRAGQRAAATPSRLGWIDESGGDARPSAGTSIGPLAETLHITNAGADDGHAVYHLGVTPDMLNPQGLLHGGAVYVMVDFSMGGATMSVLPPGQICATIEIKISYLASVRGGELTCVTDIIKRGRKIVFLESKVRDGSDKLVASASGSFALIDALDETGP